MYLHIHVSLQSTSVLCMTSFILQNINASNQVVEDAFRDVVPRRNQELPQVFYSVKLASIEVNLACEDAS